MSVLSRDLARCRRTLDSDPRSPTTWHQVAQLLRRTGQIPTEIRAFPTRDLRAAHRAAPDDSVLGDFLLRWLGVEALDLPEEELGAFWTQDRPARRVGGVWFDPEEGMPLVVQHRASGTQLLWIPRMEGILGPPLPPRHKVPAVPDLEVAGGGYLGRYPVTRDAWKRFQAATGAPPLEPALSEHEDLGARPAQQASQQRAREFSTWAGGCLPDGADWEIAGRADTGAALPWGDLPLRGAALPTVWWEQLAQEARAEDDESEGLGLPAPAIGMHPETRSPFGIEELSGFSCEWVAEPGARRGGLFWEEAQGGLRRRRIARPSLAGTPDACPAPLYLRRKPRGLEYPSHTAFRLWIPVDR